MDCLNGMQRIFPCLTSMEENVPSGLQGAVQETYLTSEKLILAASELLCMNDIYI